MCVLEQKRIESFKGNKAKSGGGTFEEFLYRKMGFPRVISKNNKIYTKLGDFCLSSDGHQFWIVCHTCQEELQTQDNFWKHIQDEHNFRHGFKQVRCL